MRFLLIFLLICQCVFAKVDYNQLQNDRKYCYQIKTSNCFLTLINNYSTVTREWKNILRYDAGLGYMWEENYPKAKEYFNSVLFHESNNQQLRKLAQQRLNEISEIYRKIARANNLDAGDYYDKNGDNLVWQKPYNIRVYIASNTGKESILKRAFSVWDDRMMKTVNFTYVDNDNDADIIIKFVNSLDGTKAGVTKYSSVAIAGNKKYLKKVNIEVSLRNPYGGKYTDTNLLSTALHEIAHGLGITYHSDNKNDILYYSVESYKNNSISRRDVNTIQQLYR